LAESFFPGEDPIGQTLGMGRREWRIEGVMENVADLPAIVRQELAGFDPSLVIHNVRPMREIMGAAIAAERFSFVLMGVFAAVALLLAAVGIYGVLAFSVSQRTQEIGIRVALGADIPTVLFGVGTTDPLTYVVVPAALIVVAFFAAYLPARRATKIDPMEALRLE